MCDGILLFCRTMYPTAAASSQLTPRSAKNTIDSLRHKKCEFAYLDGDPAGVNRSPDQW